MGKTKGNMNWSKPADEVARDLIGRTLLLPDGYTTPAEKGAWTKFVKGNNPNYEPLAARVIETEAFETHEDVTTARNCMLAAPGQVDVMKFRGHPYFNIGSKKTGYASCVMLRAVEVGGEVIDGPGRVGRQLNVEGLAGLVFGTDLKVHGTTATSGRLAGNGSKTSCGGYRLQ